MTKLLFLFIVIFTYSGTRAQHSSSVQKHITQNLLLHFNSNSPNGGDSLHFRCYMINNINHIENDNNLYIILSDKNGRFISRDKFPVINSGAYGSILIPKELESGIYNIQAFTPYLINNKTVKVNQIFVNNILKAGSADLVCKIYNNNRLISRMQNSFFVKTENTNGVPASYDVFITDKDNKEQSRFFTDLNGVGKVTFVPQKNQVYNLNINSNNRMYKFPLTAPDSNGINMLISYDSNIVKYQITKKYKIPLSQDLFTIVASQKNNEVYTSRFSFDNYETITGGLNVESLHTGILKFALLNNDGASISSTSIYLQNDNDFEQVQQGPVSISKNNNSVAGFSFSGKATRFFSVSVEKMDSLNASLPNNSDFDFFYLNALNNREENEVVDFYRISKAGNKNFASTYKILSPNKIIFNEDGSGIKSINKLNDEYATIITGKVYNSKNEKPFTNGILNIYYTTADTTLNYNTAVNADGSFALDSLIFFGTQKFYYRYFDTRNAEISCKVKLTKNKNDELLDSLLVYRFNYKPTPETEGVIISDVKAPLMQEVKIQNESKKSKTQTVNDLLTTGIYSGQSSAFIDNINNPPVDGSMPGSNFIKNRIPNIAFQNGNLVNTKNFSLGSSNFWVIGVLVDETPASLSDLNTLSAKDIALVKFFDAGHISAGMINPGGVMAVYTLAKLSNNNLGKSKDGQVDAKENSQSFQYKGFNQNVYTTLDKFNFTNKSNSVYWNPAVILEKDKNTFSFEMERLEPGKVYKVSIKGYNEMGQLINFETVLKN